MSYSRSPAQVSSPPRQGLPFSRVIDKQTYRQTDSLTKLCIKPGALAKKRKCEIPDNNDYSRLIRNTETLPYQYACSFCGQHFGKNWNGFEFDRMPSIRSLLKHVGLIQKQHIYEGHGLKKLLANTLSLSIKGLRMESSLGSMHFNNNGLFKIQFKTFSGIVLPLTTCRNSCFILFCSYHKLT